MSNNRNKGKVIERWFATKLRSVFPNVRRNAGTQAQSGGVDLERTDPFNIEIKGGKAYKSKMIRDCINQAQSEGRESNWTLLLVKPDREEPYAVVPFPDFMEILEVMHEEKII